MCAHPLGLEKAKSLLVVKDDKTFIDLIAEQVGGGNASVELLSGRFAGSTSREGKAVVS